MKRPFLLLAALALTAFAVFGAGVATAATASAATLSGTEAADLQHMREEEKLARDVYTVMNTKYGSSVRVFANIAKSESRHTLAVKRLLTVYNVADPVAADIPGVFADPGMQQLYNSLVAQGSTSLTAALQVGVAIEELDIADLQKCIARTTNASVKRVYTNLLDGSRNHLTAFQRVLDGCCS
jgi:hypothetical protein